MSEALEIELYRQLNDLGLEQLHRLMERWDEWYLDGDIFPERQSLNMQSKGDIIDWIMGTDPIYDEGGLEDFLQDELNDIKA
jgi:hypothetical protein